MPTSAAQEQQSPGEHQWQEPEEAERQDKDVLAEPGHQEDRAPLLHARLQFVVGKREKGERGYFSQLLLFLSQLLIKKKSSFQAKTRNRITQEEKTLSI